MTPPEIPTPVLPSSARIAAVVVGLAVLAVGGFAVFTTDNQLGSTALVAAGVAIAGLAVFANRIEAVEAGGVRLELEREARTARIQAQRARAAGKPEQAQHLERKAEGLLAAATMVGSRYEDLVATEPSGWDRTSRMEGLLREARALDTEILGPSDVAQIFGTGTDGSRIAALALAEADPRLATADMLVSAIGESRSSFEQYHGLLAAERSLRHLSPADRSRVHAAIEGALDGPLGDRSSDRRTVARRILGA
ncbi:hypothetical protein [Aeromicrobium sp.]|uniref:hypothetical protein n=1 Tax=Aeromicrobium sp. TaxID=1871063 RepID=UPI0028AA88DC|nr:hypothetical protein [Aeromicrobium sp.]